MFYSFYILFFEVLIDKKLIIIDWDVMMSKFERREIDKLYMYKKESLIKLCDIYLILLFILIVKKKF